MCRVSLFSNNHSRTDFSSALKPISSFDVSLPDNVHSAVAGRGRWHNTSNRRTVSIEPRRTPRVMLHSFEALFVLTTCLRLVKHDPNHSTPETNDDWTTSNYDTALYENTKQITRLLIKIYILILRIRIARCVILWRLLQTEPFISLVFCVCLSEGR